MGRPFSFILLMIWTSVFATAKGQDEPRSVFPADREVPGWSIVDPPAIFEGEYLYDHIDGGADLYLEYGFVRVLTGKFSDLNNNVIQVEVYEMKDDAAAFGIFSVNHSRSESNRKFGDGSVIGDGYVVFYKSNYYVNVSWVTRQDDVDDEMQQLAGAVDRKIGKTDLLPGFLRKLATSDELSGVIYFRGNIGLSNIYYFDYKDIFHVENGYNFQFGTNNILLFEYLEQSASDVFSELKETLSASRRFNGLEMAFQGFLISDSKGRKLYFGTRDNFILVLIMEEFDINYQLSVDKLFTIIE